MGSHQRLLEPPGVPLSSVTGPWVPLAQDRTGPAPDRCAEPGGQRRKRTVPGAVTEGQPQCYLDVVSCFCFRLSVPCELRTDLRGLPTACCTPSRTFTVKMKANDRRSVTPCQVRPFCTLCHMTWLSPAPHAWPPMTQCPRAAVSWAATRRTRLGQGFLLLGPPGPGADQGAAPVDEHRSDSTSGRTGWEGGSGRGTGSGPKEAPRRRAAGPGVCAWPGATPSSQCPAPRKDQQPGRHLLCPAPGGSGSPGPHRPSPFLVHRLKYSLVRSPSSTRRQKQEAVPKGTGRGPETAAPPSGSWAPGPSWGAATPQAHRCPLAQKLLSREPSSVHFTGKQTSPFPSSTDAPWAGKAEGVLC